MIATTSMVDGWGRLLQTMTDAELDDGNGGTSGGAIVSGWVEFDGRGRAITQGQPFGRRGAGADSFVDYITLGARMTSNPKGHGEGGSDETTRESLRTPLGPGLSNEVELTSSFRYDPIFNLITSIIVPVDEIAYSYDGGGRVKGVTRAHLLDPATDIVKKITYDEFGSRKRIELGTLSTGYSRCRRFSQRRSCCFCQFTGENYVMVIGMQRCAGSSVLFA